MKPLLEHDIHFSRSEIVNQGMKVQNRAYGVLDIPFLDNLIKSDPSVKEVLDIGTGEGSFILEVAKRNPGTSFTGIDRNGDLIEMARTQASSDTVGNAAFEPAFFDESFDRELYDLIFTRFTIEHASDPKSFIREVYDRLKPGGIFVVVDEYWLDLQFEDDVWQRFRQFMLKTYEAFKANPFIPRDLSGWLHNAGYKNVKSCLPVYSPATIGYDNFKELVLNIPVLINKFLPDTWDEEYLSELEVWLNTKVKEGKIDPAITMAHITANK